MTDLHKSGAPDVESQGQAPADGAEQPEGTPVPVAGTETIERRGTTEAAPPARHTNEWMLSLDSKSCKPYRDGEGRIVLGCAWPDATKYPKEYWDCPKCRWTWRLNRTVDRWYHQPRNAER